MDVKTAIQTGDHEALRRLLADDPSRANALIRWGKNECIHTHPLHFVSDMLFDNTLARGRELPLIDALIAAGSDVNFHSARSETPLLGAASLGAEEAGIRLLEAGANPHIRGIFGETALHWAATIGADRLVGRLIEAGAELDLKDRKYDSAPLGWALHGWAEPPPGGTANHRAVVVRLVVAGAKVEPAWIDAAVSQQRADVAAALRGESEPLNP